MTCLSMLELIRQDYIRTAHSKGLSDRRVITRHCVRNAVIPVITVICMKVSVINLIVDLSYAFIDPRFREQYARG